MKQGDKIPVTIAGQVVAHATVKELGDGTATLVVPGTLVVMAVRTEIAPEVERVNDSTSETVITGVDRASAPVETPEVDPAPIVVPPRAASAADVPVGGASDGPPQDTPQPELPPVSDPSEEG